MSELNNQNREIYEYKKRRLSRRIERFRRISVRMQKRLRVLIPARLIAFLSIIVPPFVVGGFFNPGPGIATIVSLPGIIIFGWLIAKNQRLRKFSRRIDFYSDFYSRSLSGITGELWSDISHPSGDGEGGGVSGGISGSAKSANLSYISDEDLRRHPSALDLDLFGPFSLFRLLNRTVTEEGSRTLARFISDQPDSDALDPSRYGLKREAVEELAKRRIFRMRFLSSIGIAGDAIPELSSLSKIRIDSPGALLRTLIYVSMAFPPLSFISYLLFAFEILPPYFMLTIPIQFIFYLVAWKIASPFYRTLDHALPAIEGSLQLFRSLGSVKFHSRYLDELSIFRDRPVKELSRLAWAAGLFQIRKNPLIHFPLGVITLHEYYIMLYLFTKGPDLISRSETHAHEFGLLDALISLAVYGDETPGVTEPERLSDHDDTLIRGDSVGHPLIDFEKITGNALKIDLSRQRLLLITGSNMSGKSTYLRSAGITVTMAMAGCRVPAVSFAFRPVRLFTSMRQKDDILRSLSLFYAEVKRIRQLLDQVERESSVPVFYLIDEMLRGTNNRERLIASRSVINILLNHSCSGMISTHDLELSLLSERDGVECFHFQEIARSEGLVFDHKLKKGPVRGTNALEILRQEGIPIAENEL